MTTYNIGLQIRKLRKLHNLEQKELGLKLGVSKQTISHWEKNERLPDVIKLKIMADMFGVSMDYYFEGD